MDLLRKSNKDWSSGFVLSGIVENDWILNVN